MGRKEKDKDFIVPYEVHNHKIMTTMEQEKRNRLIECAMKEFTKGYALANMDELVKEAGISKGLLFHYFGTKKGVFLFLFKYALSVINREYEKVIVESGDFLENIWTVSKLAVDLSFQYPVVYGFLTKSYFSIDDVFPEGLPKDVTSSSDTLLKKIQESSSKSMFKADIDYKKSQNIILWTMNGFIESLFTYGTDIEAYQSHYENCMKELDEYLQLLRKLLYR